MTSREQTGFLPRVEARDWRRTPADWAWLIGLGAVQWPWLLRSLRGGARADKARLLDELGLPGDALPHLGSWKADVGFLRLIADHVAAAQPREVVEFGAGASTLIIAKALEQAGGGRLTSFDQHEDFVAATRAWLAEHGLAADLRAASLVPGAAAGLWYDHGPLPETIDLLILDGPPWTVHPLTRGNAETLFDRVAPGGTILLDDAARPGERIVARGWRKRWPDFTFELVKSGTKGTLVGRRRA